MHTDELTVARAYASLDEITGWTTCKKQAGCVLPVDHGGICFLFPDLGMMTRKRVSCTYTCANSSQLGSSFAEAKRRRSNVPSSDAAASSNLALVTPKLTEQVCAGEQSGAAGASSSSKAVSEEQGRADGRASSSTQQWRVGGRGGRSTADGGVRGSSEVTRPPLSVGMSVKVSKATSLEHSGQHPFCVVGRIAAIHAGGVMRIEYDDGEVEEDVLCAAAKPFERRVAHDETTGSGVLDTEPDLPDECPW